MVLERSNTQLSALSASVAQYVNKVLAVHLVQEYSYLYKQGALMNTRVQLQVDTNKEFIKALKKIALEQDKTLRGLVIDTLVEKHPALKVVAND